MNPIQNLRLRLLPVFNNAWNWFPHIYIYVSMSSFVNFRMKPTSSFFSSLLFIKCRFNCMHSACWQFEKKNYFNWSFNAQLVCYVDVELLLRHTIVRAREREEKIKLRKCHKANNWKFPFTVLSFTLRVSRSHIQSPADVIKTATKEQLSKKKLWWINKVKIGAQWNMI